MTQKETVLGFKDGGWFVATRFFGIPTITKNKYYNAWQGIMDCAHHCLMKEPYLSQSMKATVEGLQRNVPKMISFKSNPLYQHPWERISNCQRATCDPPAAVDADLLALMRDMMGAVSLPALYGRTFAENYPNILQDVYDMDAGMPFLLMGLPEWAPIPKAQKAYEARARIWAASNELQEALDAITVGQDPGPRWQNLDDVSELIKRRNRVFREAGLKPEERGDLTVSIQDMQCFTQKLTGKQVLWALSANANLIVFWLILHILRTPGLADRVREETKPFVQITPSGSADQPPQLKIMEKEIASDCQLFRACFFEVLRLCNQPWSVRRATQDITISSSRSKKNLNAKTYDLRKGEFVTMPHELHMLDPAYWNEPMKFQPERFLVPRDDGKLYFEQGTMRPWGGGWSMCKGRIFAERECMGLVASILHMWDIEPATEEGFFIPGQTKGSAVSIPTRDVRVRIRRRREI
jgi:hypothetical protein